jgi:uncharacterized protein YukE
MSSFDQQIMVQIAALQSAAGAIFLAADTARFATGRIRSASSAGEAFGGEPAGAAFTGACARVIQAAGSIGDCLDQLATNTSAASQGYIVTDEGAMPSSFGMHGGLAWHQRHDSPEQPHAEARQP